MIQNLCRSFTVAAVVCATGMPLAASAEQTEGNARANLQETVEVAVDQSDAAASEIVPNDRDAARLEPEASEISDLFRVAAHTLDEQRIAILHVDDLPVLTFVEQAESTAATKVDSGAIAADNDELLQRAEGVARQIDNFHQAAGDPHEIGVRWDEELEEYAITLGDEQLVLINEATRYVNSTGQLRADALQATNRLRNLLGASEELTEIEGAPEPEVVAVQSNWGVASTFTGRASWYGPGFHGRHTASGEVFNRHGLTAAHRTLPFGTQVRVTNVSNNRQVVVRINDRGPFSHGRVLDLSEGAAREIGLHLAGVGNVRVEVLTD